MASVLLLIAVTICCLLYTCNTSCEWTVSGYGKVDLSLLSNYKIIQPRDGADQYQLFFTPCGNGVLCETNSMSAAGLAAQMFSEDNSCNGVISKWNNGATKPHHEINENGEHQIVFDYPKVDNIFSAGCGGEEGGRYGEFIFICDENVETYSDVQFWQDDHSGDDPCYYHTILRTKYACCIECGGGGDDGNDDELNDGLSGGWIFIIILICCLSIYCIGGYIMNGMKSKDWMNYKGNVPQFSTFWIYVPRLVKAGCMVSYEYLRGKIGGDGSNNDTGDIYEKY